MRLRDVSMLVAALALAALAVAALVAAFRDAEPTPVTVQVMLPEPEPVVAPPKQPPAEPQPNMRPDDGLQIIEINKGSSNDSNLAVARWVENTSLPGQYGWTLAFYSLQRINDDKSKLVYLGSRFIEHDVGFDAVEFDFKKGYLPEDFRKYHAKARESAAKDD